MGLGGWVAVGSEEAEKAAEATVVAGWVGEGLAEGGDSGLGLEQSAQREMWGDRRRYGEIRGRYGESWASRLKPAQRELWGDMGRYGGDMGRYGASGLSSPRSARGE